MEPRGSLPSSQQRTTWPNSEPRWIHCTALTPIYFRYVLIVSSHLRLGLPGSRWPSDLHTKTLYAPFPFPIRATCPVSVILLDLISPDNIWEGKIHNGHYFILKETLNTRSKFRMSLSNSWAVRWSFVLVWNAKRILRDSHRTKRKQFSWIFGFPLLRFEFLTRLVEICDV
jgi:hypothetical protein